MNTTLRAYLDELQQLFEQEALEEVMGHCRHILQHFPKNVETYRLLGRALLDKSRPDEAGDVFQRVLSALPDDFIAHLGLSGIAEESGQLPAAIWHLERAYEQEPNNAALRDEIKRLVEKRDGQPTPRIQLTRGGLAHTYAKGRMYEQAITELQSALEQMPERIDLQLLLAKVLWESERPVEASDVALKVLEVLPNSIEANQIMARLWLKANRPSDAAPFISRLEQLDPFLAWATIHPDGEEFPRDALQLPRLQWDARAAAAMTTDAPDWVRSLPDVFESPENVSLTGNVTNWLESAAPAPSSGKSSLLKRGSATAQPPASEEVPDWFKESAGQASTADGGIDEVPDWFKEPSATAAVPDLATDAAIPAEEVPDWFAEAAPPATSDAGTNVESAALPDWFSDAAPEAAPTAEKNSPTPAPEIPDWLDEAPAAQVQATAESPAAVEIPSWLDDELPSANDMLGEQLPSGFTDLLAGSSPRSGSQTMTPEAAQSAAIPDWLSDDQTGNAQPAAPAGEVLDAMAWLADEPSAPDNQAAPISTASDSAMSFDNMDDMFSSEPPAQAELAPAEPGESAPDWLIGMKAAEPTAASAVPSSAEDEMSLSFDDMFSSEPPAQAELAPAEPGESAPDWLIGMKAAEPTAASAAPSPAEDEMSLSFDDMFGSAPQTEQPTAQPADSEMDWLSSIPSTSTPSAPTAEAQGMDSAASLEFQSSENWMGSTETSEPAAVEVDPMAWMRDYSGDQNVQAETVEFTPAEEMGASQDEEPLVQGEAPDWLADMAPPSTPTPTTADVSALDFSALDMAGAAVELPQDEEPLVQGEAPDWLANIAPSSTPTPTTADASALDFSALDMAGSSAEGDDWFASSSPSALPAASPEPTDSTEDWFGSSGAATQETTSEPPSTGDLDWLNQPAASSQFQAQGAGEPASSMELEDDWLASFEAPLSEPTVSAPSDDSWLSQLGTSTLDTSPAENTSFDLSSSAPSTASSADDWLGSLGAAQAEPATTTTGDDWLGSLSTDAAETEEPLEPLGATNAAGEMGNDWLTSITAPSSEPEAALSDWAASELGEPEAAEPEASGDVPDWMRGMQPATAAPTGDTSHDWMPPEAQDEFNKLLQGAAQNRSQSRETKETGILDASALPDWLNAFGDSSEAPASDEPAYTGDAGKSPSVSMALADLNFENLDTTDQPEPLAPGDTPDWLSNIAPKQPAQSSVPAAPLGDLDFAGLAVGSAAEDAAAEESPDWLKAMAPVDTGAKPAEPQAAPQGSGSPDFTFDFDRVAQPANLVNTKPESGTETQPPDSGFAFNRTPAWMKKKSTKGSQK